ncbi:LLM class flavin-dependent oxidoreductase [Roseomonas sp. BU-1]|uniref:LLM class flavin-dependent oxidoreductase n=2 Tax=Falsiroseomonas selenitidurans TaxID=2716335 RepID=A0ABX1E234_9PROT|nr:LLM class flavin-dependent oxidoreductase [Falsiroseomonas selenitidurans]
MHLAAFLFTPGSHSAGWRHPDAVTECDMDFSEYVHIAQVAERGKMDTIFFQDTVAVNGSGALDGVSRYRLGQGRTAYLEPTTLLAALAVVTQRIGLIATATTTYNEPYNIARRFASIDHISQGRAGWNLVTSQIEDEAGNFGADHHMLHAERYERAEEFFDVVAALWDSFGEGALIRDKASGHYIDPTKIHFQDHVGKHFKVRGPLNVARCPQGRPVVTQAGSSGPGMELAARTADLVFTAQSDLAEAQAFYRDLKARAERHGRDPAHIKIMPGLMTIIGATEEEAQAKYRDLQGLLSDENSMRLLARLCGDLDIFALPPDAPLPPLPLSNAAQARQRHLMDKAKRDNLSIIQTARYLATSLGHHLLVGTPERIVDTMALWVEQGACDGFTLLSPHYPKPLEQFVAMVVPELQRRGLFRTAYTGTTLREHLGLPVPPNRYER